MKTKSPVMHRVGERRVVFTDGETVRSFRLNPVVFALIALVFLSLSVAFVGSAAYLFFRDDLLTAALVRQHRLQVAYEDRISDLRRQIDRIASRQLINQEGFEARIDRLMDRQRSILERRDAIDALLERASEAGLTVPSVPAPPSRGDTVERHSSLFGIDAHAADTRLRGTDPERLLAGVESDLLATGQVEMNAIEQITRLALRRTDAIRSEVALLGVEPDAIANPDAVGGPFEPPHLDAETTDTLTEAAGAIESFMALRDGLSELPLRRPVEGARTSSTFGNRVDPFLGRRAFHAGLDFAATSGTTVMATGAGRVIRAGRNGGYGLMVEIDHGHNLTTRYAHLSRILVSEGDTVTAGEAIGRVGSTGRSTGPHLHYEVRRSDDPENPQAFLNAARHIATYLD
ncbi:MAG: peptidoglycan DD-metalloendopeptidase family protein [Hyphomicrobiaceae bacterium]|nr:peptidoglycan DD-metalloendopeptidase family protein [Hyphomicrobiaceae bacterium]